MSKVFFRTGNFYTYGEDNFEIQATLDNGIFQLHYNPDKREFFLERIQDEFMFGFKLYGVDEVLTNHVVDTYNKQPIKRNIGVLLNGAKGTGKTVTAKLIANKIGLPVIICDNPYPGLAQFLSGINHDCIFFFDEFEKNFRMKCDDDDCAGEDLLSIMDGVYNSEHCHIFLLTTNELKINDNLLSRPSRIRYLKSFGDIIDRHILEEFIDDNLIYKERKQDILDFIDTLTMCTIDIVKSIVEEINIHNCDIKEFESFFNIKKASYRYYVKYKNIYDYETPSISKKEFLKYMKTSFGKRDKEFDWSPDYLTYTFNISIKKFKVGDTINNGEWIIDEIDLDNNYMYVKQPNGYRQRHMYIENIDAQPNLYKNQNDAYGYSDYDY